MRLALLATLIVLSGCTAKGAPSRAAEGPSLRPSAEATNEGGGFDASTSFTLDDEVDPGGVENDLVRRHEQLTLRVAKARGLEGARVIEVDWGLPEALRWVGLPTRFAFRGASLWVLDGSFAVGGVDRASPDDALARALRMPPSIADLGAPGPHCLERGGEGMYGPLHEELCFDRRGVVSWSESNANGPRTTKLVRADAARAASPK